MQTWDGPLLRKNSQAITDQQEAKLSMNSKETLGEYLTSAKTLVKSKIKDATSWNSDIDEADITTYATDC